MPMLVGPNSDYVGRSKLWTPRWYPLKYHPVHDALWHSEVRFRTVPAGRRSGKTELAKRYGVRLAYKLPPMSLIGFGAPTFAQAKNIFWKDMKELVSPLMTAKISETELTITLITGTEIRVVGMDKPERVEGQPWDWLCLDEFANMKETAWIENVYPALSTVGKYGKAWLIGVPEGRNHYYELDQKAKRKDEKEWASFHWKSAEILPERIVEQARRDLDPLTFQQEFEADFVNFAGRAYHQFDVEHHVIECRHEYNPRAPLLFCFDFNVEPGTASVCQYVKTKVPHRQEAVMVDGRMVLGEITESREVDVLAVIGEVWQPRNSNTELVCNKLLADWGEHQGRIELFGDATGGARGTAKLTGSDWEIIMQVMRNHFGTDRVKRRGKRTETGAWVNPYERERVNAVNSLLRSASGAIRLIVDPSCPEMIKDLDGVRLVEGGSGEIDKKHDPKRTHLSDGLGYCIEHLHPIREKPGLRVTEDFV